MDKEVLKGSIDLLLLSLIEKKDLYGYDMMRILKKISNDTYHMSEGTLYAALKRMERKTWIASYWSETDSGRRKYYHITDSGKKELQRKLANWEWMNQLVQQVAGETQWAQL